MPDDSSSSILIYSRGPLVAQLLRQHSNHIFHTVDNSQAFFSSLVEATPLAAILNTIPQDPILVQLKELQLSFPLIVLADHANVGGGASLHKPVRLQELLQTLEDCLTQGTELQLNAYYRLSLISRTLVTALKKIALTEKEVALLEYLHQAKGKSRSKAELLHHIWGYNELVDTHTLETHIYRLRQKLEEGEELVITEEDGYRIRGGG